MRSTDLPGTQVLHRGCFRDFFATASDLHPRPAPDSKDIRDLKLDITRDDLPVNLRNLHGNAQDKYQLKMFIIYLR